MGKLAFNVDAYTARLIGRENLSKVESAIIELVKNTYDADASVCILYYEKKSDTLYLCDNGIGMTEDIIKKHWMTIGHSSKLNTYISDKGRVQTGSKGIGRFALDRISSKCEMLTSNKNDIIKWTVNWDDFEAEKQITEIFADIEETNETIIEFLNKIENIHVNEIINKEFLSTGTIFKLTGLRDIWTDSLIDRIYKTLYNLASPDLQNIFDVYFFTQYSKLEDSLICTDNEQSYDYKISFEIKHDGKTKIFVHRNEFDFEDRFEEIMESAKFSLKDRQYFLGELIDYDKDITYLLPGVNLESATKIGSFSGSIYFNKISTTKPDKEKYFYKDITGRKNYSKEFGGIKIYRDKFKVRPYGEYGTQNFDWLMLSGRKAKSPAAISSEDGQWKVSGEQIIGEVNISRTNLMLADQANREGLVQTKEFNLFKDALTSIIEIIEKDRQYVIRKLSKLNRDTIPVEQYKIEIDDLIKKEFETSKYNQKSTASKINVVEAYKVKAVLEERNDIIKNLEDENAMLRTLATTGIVTNTYIHELKGLANELFSAIVAAKESLDDLYSDSKEDELKEILEDVKDAYSYKNKFSSWFKVTIETVREDRRHMKKWNINNLINQLTKSWEEVLAEKNIKILFIENAEIEQRCFAYEIESVIHNLVTNSVSAFERNQKFIDNKLIEIELEENNNGFMVIYRDNGPGLTQAFKDQPNKILEAFETDKRNADGEKIGTGMGMWIIKRIVENYHGTVDLKDNIDSENGFKIKLLFFRRKNNKE